MDIIAHTITRFIQIKCGSLDLWKGPFNQVEEALQTVRIFFSFFIFPRNIREIFVVYILGYRNV